MPELPEVQTVVTGLKPFIVGKVIEKYTVSNKSFRGKSIELIPMNLIGAKIIDCKRKAKYILINLSNGYTLLLHLGMSGKILVSPFLKEDKHDHLIIDFTDSTSFKFNDPRRFGYIKIINTHDLNNDCLLNSLGFEPLKKNFNGKILVKICAGRKIPIKHLLMNANIVVGIGNIYASEILFEAAILPTRLSSTLSQDEILKLYKAIIKVLNLAIKSGGSTLRDYVRSDGDIGYFQHQFNVYNRHKQKCNHCSKLIEKIVMSNRSTFYCSSCQI